jgi:hypothetical protein
MNRKPGQPGTKEASSDKLLHTPVKHEPIEPHIDFFDLVAYPTGEAAVPSVTASASALRYEPGPGT